MRRMRMFPGVGQEQVMLRKVPTGSWWSSGDLEGSAPGGAAPQRELAAAQREGQPERSQQFSGAGTGHPASAGSRSNTQLWLPKPTLSNPGAAPGMGSPLHWCLVVS